jgi:predicted dehydrogenase/ADP-ribose pyrophosphatase YjhB (NUDIX family)
MKVLLVGLGSFGAGWYGRIVRDHPALQIAVVDTDPARAERITDPGIPFYSSLEEAIVEEQPTFVLNATPPDSHTTVNHIAFDHSLPVLCEKPIAEDYEDAVWIVARAEQEGIPFMIAENYRRAPAMRTARALIAAGAIGDLSTMHCALHQPYRTDKPYFCRMRHPFLVDVVVHHLDLMRYLAQAEGRRVLAHSYRPLGSWHSGNLALTLSLELEGGVHASLAGSLLTQGTPTGWPGRWRIEGTGGTIAVEHDVVRLTRNGAPPAVHGSAAAGTGGPLADFVRVLSGEEGVETLAADYVRTQALVYHAQQSSERGCAIDVELPRGYAVRRWNGHDLYRVTRYQGAIVRDDHVLLIRHEMHDGSNTYWLLPGGGREPRETRETCVKREMLEETHLKVQIERLLVDEVAHPESMYGRRRTYLCTPVGGEAQPGSEPEPDAAAAYAIAEVAWFDLRDESGWPTLLLQDPFTYPQMRQIRAALGYS